MCHLATLEREERKRERRNFFALPPPPPPPLRMTTSDVDEFGTSLNMELFFTFK